MLERARSSSSSKENKITIEFNFIPLNGLKLNFPYRKENFDVCIQIQHTTLEILCDYFTENEITIMIAK